MPLNEKAYAKFLTEYAEELDIPPSKYQQAVDRYMSVGNWLTEGESLACNGTLPAIYAQGSFRLGTVVRPLRNMKEGDYDIDLVCELPHGKSSVEPVSVKLVVGDRLKEHGSYQVMLDDEGSRCWTLEYAEQDSIGFHLDVLPCVLDSVNLSGTAISLTHKSDEGYSWSPSDPNAYAAWFLEMNKSAYLLAEQVQKQQIYQYNLTVFGSIADVPDQLVRTPLQRAIQILKRHRDIAFDKESISKFAPISMIITTLAAQVYDSEPDVYLALKGIVSRLHAYTNLLKSQGILNERALRDRLIQRSHSGEWYIGNPVNPAENFADKWNADNGERARHFFLWVERVNRDLIEIINSYDRKGVRASLVSGLGPGFIDNKFDDIWPLVNPKPNIEAASVKISDGQRPWRKV